MLYVCSIQPRVVHSSPKKTEMNSRSHMQCCMQQPLSIPSHHLNSMTSGTYHPLHIRYHWEWYILYISSVEHIHSDKLYTWLNYITCIICLAVYIYVCDIRCLRYINTSIWMHSIVHSNLCLPCDNNIKFILFIIWIYIPCTYSSGVPLLPGCPPPWPCLPQHPGGWGEAAQDIRLWSLQRHTWVRVLPPGQDATEVDGTRDCDRKCLHGQVWCVRAKSFIVGLCLFEMHSNYTNSTIDWLHA